MRKSSIFPSGERTPFSKTSHTKAVIFRGTHRAPGAGPHIERLGLPVYFYYDDVGGK